VALVRPPDDRGIVPRNGDPSFDMTTEPPRSADARLAAKRAPTAAQRALVSLGVALLVAVAVFPSRSRRWETTRRLFTTRDGARAPARAPQASGDTPPAPPPPPSPPAPAAPAAPPAPPAPRAPPPPVAPTAAERLAFGSLRVGGRVAGGVVTALEGLRGGSLRVYVRLPEGPIEVEIARAEGTNAPPPVAAGPYAIYYAATPVPYPTFEPVLRAVADALARDPARVPAGLRPLLAVEPPR